MLIKSIRKNLLAVLANVYSLLVALFWLALRVNWSGISKALGADKNPTFIVMELPLLVCILLWVLFALEFASLIFLRNKKWPHITSLALSGVFTMVIIVVIALGAIDYMQFILPKFAKGVVASLAVVTLALLLFFPPIANCKKCIALKAGCVAIALLATVLVAFDVKANGFTCNAVVYAVEDDYQIVFATNDNSIAWVEIDGEQYHDTYAGSSSSADLVHKITVPQSKLDQAKSYSIHAQQMIYRGPFGGYKGAVISQNYNFRPVDSTDGLVYYTMTDVHGAREGAVATAKNVQNMDFLVVLGDMYSMIDSHYDALFAGMVAHDVTKGEIPCVYARGNHEIKGDYAEQLHKYVGADGENFYYTFTLSNVFGITLDLGEDHDDDWWEYYGTAHFETYHAEQTAMLQKLVEDKPYQNYDYTIVACHIPIPFVNSRHNHTEVKATWTDLLNQIEPDLVLSGHQHDLYPFFENTITLNEKGKLVYNSQFVGKQNKTYGGYVTDFAFNSFIAGRRGSTQTDEVGALDRANHIGLATYVDLANGTQKSVYLNSKGEQVLVFNPFVEGAAQTEFVTNLK